MVRALQERLCVGYEPEIQGSLKEAFETERQFNLTYLLWNRGVKFGNFV